MRPLIRRCLLGPPLAGLLFLSLLGAGQAEGRTYIYGGSFNPPTRGHEMLIRFVRENSPPGKILVVPTYEHAYSKALVSFDHRLAMTQLLTKDIAGTEVSDIERQLGGTSFTLRMVKALKAKAPEEHFVLVAGSDVFLDRAKWRGWDELEKLVELLPVGRQGYHYDGILTSIPDISSTQVRQLLAEKKEVSHLVPRRVLDYVFAHGLYQSSSTGSARSTESAGMKGAHQ